MYSLRVTKANRTIFMIHRTHTHNTRTHTQHTHTHTHTQCCPVGWAYVQYTSYYFTGTIVLSQLKVDQLQYFLSLDMPPPPHQMYAGGRLVYADSVFNGYGTTKRDFLKQVYMWTVCLNLPGIYVHVARASKYLTLYVTKYFTAPVPLSQSFASLSHLVPVFFTIDFPYLTHSYIQEPSLSPSLVQVERCAQEASRGHCIPTDYQFTSHSGGRHPASTSWAYPLGGVLGFLVPYSSSSLSSQCSSERHTQLEGDNEDRETPLQL